MPWGPGLVRWPTVRRPSLLLSTHTFASRMRMIASSAYALHVEPNDVLW